MARQPVQINPGKNKRVALLAGALGLGMLGLAFASVPLYSLFCRVTGFAGTTQRAEASPNQVLDQQVTIRFDANVSEKLKWHFRADDSLVSVRLGEQKLAHYRATNSGTTDTVGTAVFNVTPESAGAYFNKLQCFCFTEQKLKPGETADMPVVFFVDPAMAKDPETKDIREITLSYTFYPADPSAKAGDKPSPVALSN